MTLVGINKNFMELIVIFFIVLLIVIIYFIPSFIGRNKKQANGIILLNLFLGWTLIGWVGALIWASTAENTEKMYIYKCKKCNFKTTYNQKLTLFICPNCKTETRYKSKNETH